MSCQIFQLTMKVSSPQKVDLNLDQPLMIGAVLYPRIILCQLCLIMTLGVIEREGVLGACPFDIRIVCIITGHITVSTHVLPM